MQVFSKRRAGVTAALTMALVGSMGGLGIAPAALVPAVHAQTTSQSSLAETPEQRLRRMEAEIKALQRKVFPEGAGKFFTPEIASGAPVAAPTVGAPSNTAVSDMLVRMDSIEGQITRLTAQLEETQNRLAKLEAQMAPPASAETATVPQSVTLPLSASAQPNGATISSNTAAMTGGASLPPKAPAASTSAAPVAKPAQPSADRVAAVQAIEKPQSTDRGEDEYSYGFRLWEAKFYPEAQQQLLRYVEQFPRHRRLSYARNLLGRAYLDDGKPGTAAQYFVQNYQADPAGERAPDSLLYLAVAMNRLKETKRACVALDELIDKYPAAARGRLAGELSRIRAGVKCN